MRHLTEELTKAKLVVQDLAISSARMYIKELALATGPFSSEAYKLLCAPTLRSSFAYDIAPVHYAINITTYPQSLKDSLKDDWYTYTMVQAWAGAVGYSLNSMRFEGQLILRIREYEEEAFETDGGHYDAGLVRLLSFAIGSYMARMRVMKKWGQESLIGITARDVWVGNAEFEREAGKEMSLAQVRCQERDMKFARLRSRG